jgi:TetR/AcrR family transcriptional repressor of nem operon
MGKEEILKIADKQMKAGGYKSLSFREIAENLEISKANIHHHFKNKETLAIEVTNHFAGKDFTEMTELAAKYETDFVAFMGALEDKFWEKAKDANNCSVCVCSQIVKADEVPESLLKVAQSHFDKVLGIFMNNAKKGIESKSINTTLSAQDVAMQAGIVMNGVMSLAQAMPDTKTAEQMLRGQIRIWVNGLNS